MSGTPSDAVDDPRTVELAAMAAVARSGDADAAIARLRSGLRAADRALLDALAAGWRRFRPDDPPEALAAALRSSLSDDGAALGLAARSLDATGETRPAIALARAARDRNPDHAEPLFLLCALLLGAGDPEAQDLLTQALAHFPGPAAGWVEVGTRLQAAGKRTAALVCYGRGVPSLAIAIRRGRLARELGNLDAAVIAFSDAVTLDPESGRAWFLLGLCRQDGRDFAAAVAAYRRVLAIDPAIAEAAVNLGTVLQETGDLTGAKTAYAMALRQRADAFGRIAQALSTAPKGELWLDLGQLRRDLAG